MLEDAVMQVLREKGDSAAMLRGIMEQQREITAQLAAIAKQQLAAAESLANAARTLSMRTVMPAPVVNVEVPTPEVSVDVAAPQVTVEATPTVTVHEAPEGRTVKTVERDAQGLIVRIIEEAA